MAILSSRVKVSRLGLRKGWWESKSLDINWESTATCRVATTDLEPAENKDFSDYLQWVDHVFSLGLEESFKYQVLEQVYKKVEFGSGLVKAIIGETNR